MGYNNRSEMRAENARLSRYPLPQEIKNRLMTDREVQEQLDRGADPVELSIDKWERILAAAEELSEQTTPPKYYQDFLDYIGGDSCSLCIVSIAKLKRERGAYRYRQEKCEFCPLGAVEACTAKESTFERIESIVYHGNSSYLAPNPDRDVHQELLELIRTMVANLRSL